MRALNQPRFNLTMTLESLFWVGLRHSPKSQLGQERALEYFLRSSHPIRLIIADAHRRPRSLGRFCEFQ